MKRVNRKHRNGNGLASLVDELFNPKFFENAVNDFGRNLNFGHPPVNITEKDDQFIVEVQAPGWNKEDFQIKIEEDVLSISAHTPKAEKTEAADESEVKAEPVSKSVRKEFSRKNFKRSFTLSDKINREGIEAIYNNGILTVSLTKAPEVKPEVKIVSVS